MRRSVVVLPEPDGPEQREELAGLDVEVDAVDGGDVAEAPDQAAQADVRGRSRARRRRVLASRWTDRPRWAPA